MNSKIINRKCIVTGQILPTNELIRFVLIKDGQVLLEKNEKIKGRGAYCKNEKAIIEILFKKKMLNRSFKRNISNEIYEKLNKEVIGYYEEK